MLRRVLLMASVVLCGAGQSFGDLIRFDLTGAPGDQTSQTAAFVAAGLTGGELVRGSGLTPSNATNSISSSGWTTGAVVDLNEYYGFSVTANSGNLINATTFRFNEQRSAFGVRAIEVRTSTNGFTTFQTQFTDAILDDTLNRSRVINLTGLSNVSGTIGVRIYGFLAESNAGTFRLTNNVGTTVGVVLDGTVTAVPEPSSIALVSLAGCTGLVAAYRRRKTKASVA